MTPALARVLPFAIYIAFLIVEQTAPAIGIGFDVRLLYPFKVACVTIALAILWSRYGELTTARGVAVSDWLLAAGVGVLIFVLWIILDRSWLVIGKPSGWDPVDPGRGINWLLVTARLSGAALVVPIMEELFWRSFVMRWVRDHDFLSVAPKQVGTVALLVSSALFAIEHHEWLAGLLAGLAYAWIYMRTGNLWTAVASHALTNLLLGGWVLYTRQWQFW